MPVMDGIQATKEIRRMEKANAMSGYPPLVPPTDSHTPSDTSSTDSAPSFVTSTDTRAGSSPYRSSVIIVALTASSLQSDRVAALAAGWQLIPISQSSCSGLEVVLVDIIPLRISISQFWQLIVVSASMTTLALLLVLVSALQMIYGSI